MTTQARTKICKCGQPINETARDSEKQWISRAFCSPKCRIIDKPVSTMIKLYYQGKSTAEIAELYGLSKTTVKRTFKKHNVKMRTVKERSGCRVEPSIKPFLISKYKQIGCISKAGEVSGLKYHSARAVLIESGHLKVVPQKPRIPKYIRDGVITEAKKNKTTSVLIAWGRVA